MKKVRSNEKHDFYVGKDEEGDLLYNIIPVGVAYSECDYGYYDPEYILSVKGYDPHKYLEYFVEKDELSEDTRPLSFDEQRACIKDEAKKIGVIVNYVPEFPNGFEDWHETHYHVSIRINELCENDQLTGSLKKYYEKCGTGGLMEIAKLLTDEFEKKHEGYEWDGEWCDEIDKLVESKLG